MKTGKYEKTTNKGEYVNEIKMLKKPTLKQIKIIHEFDQFNVSLINLIHPKLLNGSTS